MADLDQEAKLTQKAIEAVAGKEEVKNNTPKKTEGSIRTYASDIAEMMRKEKGSIIKIALAEQQRREMYKKQRDPTSTKNIIIIFLGIILILGGIMIFVFSIVNRAKPVDVTVFSSNLPTFLFTESQVHIDMTELNRSELINLIQLHQADDTLVKDTIKNIFISYSFNNAQTQVPFAVFLQKLGINIPTPMYSNLDSSFMLGVYGLDGPNELFTIFKVKDFNEAFLSMREWESSMLSELVRLYDIDTSSYGKVIFSKEFETEILYNKEARLLRDSSGKILLSYVFLDKETIMVTTEAGSLDEILKRINLKTLR